MDHEESLVVKVSNLPIEANEEDLIKSLQGVQIEQIGIAD